MAEVLEQQKGPDGEKRFCLDWKTLEYREQQRPKFPALEMAKQIPGMPRVLGRDQVGLLQDLQRPEGNVIQVSDRRADDIEHCRLWAGKRCHANGPSHFQGMAEISTDKRRKISRW